MTDDGRLVAGRYRLGQRIGSGAMGVVWQAHDGRLHRTVAVKQLLLQPGLAESDTDEAKRRAMREGRIAARLQHPHAIAVYDVAEDDGQPWLVMEYLPSSSLSTVLSERGTLPPREVAAIGSQVASALAAAHDAGITHRDIKPGNILLGNDGTVKITDFGISRATGDVTVTATGMLAGTPAYLAPEVAKGYDPGSPSDVFSLGSTLYAAIEGMPPFGLNENTIALLHQVASGKVTPPKQAGPLTALLMRLLRAEPEDRPTMAEAREALAAVAAGRTAPEFPMQMPRSHPPSWQGAPVTVPATGISTRAIAPVHNQGQGGQGQGGPAPLPHAPQQHVQPPQQQQHHQSQPNATRIDQRPASGHSLPPSAMSRPPAARPRAARQQSGGGSGGNNRSTMITTLAIVGAAVLGILLASFFTGDDGGDNANTPPPTVTVSKSGDAGSDKPKAQVPERPKVSGDGPTEADQKQFIEAYYGTAVADTDAGWAMLAPGGAAQGQGRSTYDAFWGNVKSVTVDSVTQQSPYFWSAKVTYTMADGSTETKTKNIVVKWQGTDLYVQSES
ncbi:serine/threonine-protein kinase [Actinosynnema pretiosum]|uniref:non-specific serine/threonine protein kinase n=1 Tax=Actinosynnema pretiosum TaxID=42197 RepID=A0A290ZEG4_9PSEU|nr:serine/threonine-protein kinase [Actinosynnema pretiosum]ATE57359.1 serine/threonine protein kinase [Actinosynnema pretiosum]